MSTSTSSQVAAFFFPPLCLACQNILSPSQPHFCQSCETKIIYCSESLCRCCGDALNPEIAASLCGACLKDPPPFEWARSVFKLSPELSKIIYAFKYSGEESAFPWMLEEMTHFLQTHFAGEKFDLIVPVPLHWWRLLRRGYNQSLLLAKGLAKSRGEKWECDLLIKKKASQAQSTLSREVRLKQLKGAFALKAGKSIRGKKILLMDDVYTTGSTLRECARILQQAGAQVYAFSLARTPLE